MPNLTQLRLAARQIFDETLRAVDAGDAVRHAVHFEGTQLKVLDATIDLPQTRPVYAIAIGKAAVAMASGLDEILGERLKAGVITSNVKGYGTGLGSEQVTTTRADAGEPHARMSALPTRYTVFAGGHPEPNEQSLEAAQACFDLLERADEEHALVVFMVSGGGSAMVEWPISADVSLADLRVANRVLVNSGASIGEINAVRRAFSAVKGGRLAARAQHCDQVTLIISDVPSGEERNVASGPTLAPALDAPDARDVIARYNFRSQTPESVLRAIDASTDGKIPDGDSLNLRKHFVLLDNSTALEAAAEAACRRGFVSEIAHDIVDQPIEEGCAALVERLGQKTATSVLISGGEFACPVSGDGIGGRNLETALRLACSTNLSLSDREDFVALCAGTDGIDGNSPAAGAIVDNTTLQRARAIGLNAEDFLKRSDTYSFFVALGDVIATGPTGTNVRDLRILLRNRPQ